MDHRAFLASLDADTRTRLTRRSTARGLAHLAGHLGLIGLTGTLIAIGGPFWWLALVPHGILLVFLFTLLHETTHRTPFAHDRLNDLVGRAAGAVMFIGFDWFRPFHLAHHRHTNDPDLDPELASPRPEGAGALVWHLSGLPAWRGALTTLVQNAVDPGDADWLSARARTRVRTEARLMILCYGLVFAILPWTWLFWLWLFPMLVGQPFLRLYLLAEHDRCAFVSDMFANTRTTLTTAPIRFIAWNMPYHSEHHTHPNVPFHRLPALHGLMMGHHKVLTRGYARFTQERLRQ